MAEGRRLFSFTPSRCRNFVVNKKAASGNQKLSQHVKLWQYLNPPMGLIQSRALWLLILCFRGITNSKNQLLPAYFHLPIAAINVSVNLMVTFCFPLIISNTNDIIHFTPHPSLPLKRLCRNVIAREWNDRSNLITF